MLTLLLPAPSPKSNKGITLTVPKVKIDAGAIGFHFCVSPDLPLPIGLCNDVV